MPYFFSNLLERILGYVPNILSALIIFTLSWYIARILANLLKRVLLRRNTASGVTHLLAEMLRWTIVVLGAIAALQRFFNVTAFLTGLGIVGFTIGFALQNIMQNFVSGIILLVQQPFKIGDEIHVLGFDGVVLQINLRTTEMQALDGRIVILPNADVISHAIVNYTRANRRRVDLVLNVSTSTAPDRLREILLDGVRNVPGYVKSPAPEIIFQDFSNSAINMNVAFWVDMSVTLLPQAKDAAISLIQESFRKEAVEISLPKQIVYVKSDS